MTELRVGRIEFANVTPIFRALEEGAGFDGVEIVTGVPTELNGMLREGTADIAPSSSFELLARPDLYGFLPDLSISSIGEVGSVLLFSHLPLEGLDGGRVGLSPASATSVALLRILLEGRMGLNPRYEEPSADNDAVLWIGDQALREARTGSWPHVYDLGRLWLDATETPCVFALWIARRDRFAASPDDFRGFYRRLVAARQRAYRSYPRYAADAAEAAWMTPEGLLAYWQDISYDLTAWHLKGLRFFAEEAYRLGLIPHVPALDPLPVEGG